jgi:hypothetical protein
MARETGNRATSLKWRGYELMQRKQMKWRIATWMPESKKKT